MNIIVDIPTQTLSVLDGEREVHQYAISTAANGAGEAINSGKTPRGKHIVRAKIGVDAPVASVFIGRRATGEIYQPGMATQFPDRDWILTRILWLSGLEPGKNRLGSVDTMRRYIYIHGVPDEVPMGCPGSKGCVRMRNADIVCLFDLVPVGSLVDIV